MSVVSSQRVWKPLLEPYDGKEDRKTHPAVIDKVATLMGLVLPSTDNPIPAGHAPDLAHEVGPELTQQQLASVDEKALTEIAHRLAQIVAHPPDDGIVRRYSLSLRPFIQDQTKWVVRLSCWVPIPV